jgi:hypothetical protein
VTAGRPPADGGTAVVETALVSVLLTLLFLGVVQVALVVHVRNVLIDAAGEGARAGALVGRTPEEGATRTRVLISSAIHPGYARDVRASIEPAGDRQLVVVSVRAPLPLVGLLGPAELDVTGRALREGP